MISALAQNTWKAVLLSTALAGLLALPACNQTGNPPDGGGTTTDGNGGADGTGGNSEGGNTLLNDASGFDGTLSGKVLDQQSTRASTADTSAAQEVPTEIDTENTTVAFLDVVGEPLLDADGAPIPTVPLNPDTTFTAEDLPVGVDFTVCVDIGSDGVCDVKSCVNIPSDDPNHPGTGHIENAQVDPLTTVVLAKLQALVEERGLDPAELPISPVALVTRIVEAYTHLFEESGIDEVLTLEDIEALSGEQLAALFDAVIPLVAQSSMQVARGNLRLAKADDVNTAALAAAEIFLQAGFPIADGGEPLNLSSLANLPGVETTTLRELFAKGDPSREEFAEVDEELAVAPAQFVNAPVEPTIYINAVAEADRNFSDDESDVEGKPGPHLPVIHDYLLVQMAKLQLEGRRISIAALHDLLTSLDTGIGARLTYFLHDPNFFGPPQTIFETSDGAGKAVNLNELFGAIAEGGFGALDHEQLQQQESRLRSVLRELLSDTTPPSLEQMAGGFLSDRVGTVNDLAATVRDARAHLPFSRTGSSTFFVVADGDPFRTDGAVSPVTVDAEVTQDGVVSSVVYNPHGEGKHYLMFTQGTERDGVVGLLVREAGRPLHGPRGPVRLNLHDPVFAAIDGVPFAEFVSETGNFFPGVNVSVVSSTFIPAPAQPAGSIAPAEDAADGPNRQIFVLATEPGPEAEPVRVDYDTASGHATYNSGGRFLLQFVPETQETGQFLLFNEQTGRPAGQEDPVNFFVPPPPRPEGTGAPNQPPPGNPPIPGDPNQPPPQGGPVDPNAPPVNPQPAQLGEGMTEPAQPPSGGQPQPPNGGPQPPTGGSQPPAGGPPPDGPPPVPFGGAFDQTGLILISIDAVAGLPIERKNFTHVFGTEVTNPRYNPDGDPYFDDINANGTQDADESTAPFRPTLFSAADWRSTDIRLYYRRSDNHAGVTFEDVDFASDTPKTHDGVALVARNFLPRLNAFRFGRPNTALNLLTAFLPPEFFDGSHALNADTTLDILGAIAVLNLMMDQVHNVQATIDPDGVGPLPGKSVLADAHVFTPPVGDPFVLLLKGFSDRTTVEAPTNSTPTDTTTTGSNSTDATTTDSNSTDSTVEQ